MARSLQITPAEFSERRERLLTYLDGRGARGFVLFGDKYIQYFTGFLFLSTERPVVLVGDQDGRLVAFVPMFEVERVQAETSFDRIESYQEYPGLEHPMTVLARVLADLGIDGTVGADSDGYPGILGYEGPSLSDATGASVVPLHAFIEGMMRCKSPAEVALIRESGRWCARAHRTLQTCSTPGRTEVEASLEATREATLAMYAELGSEIGELASSDGASAGYRGQIGRRSSWAHAIAHNITFQPGDVLVSESSAPVWGYNAELERAMVVGEPSEPVKRLFDHMAQAQQIAFGAVRPGATCAEVDGAVMAYFRRHDLLPYWRQHTGHGIGLRNHESPFLDLGDQTELRPGMVFTIEPGVYDGEVGGFRHSDTVVVTDTGMDILTDYPRDLESLTIPV